MTPEIDQVCSVSSPIIISNSHGYLANTVTMETGQGSPACPWRLEALPGQQINISLVNFARVALEEEGVTMVTKTKVCFQYAVLREGDYMRTVTECEGGSRMSHTYLSTGHQVEVEVLTKPVHHIYFLLKYQGQ